jgi:hypothetical protein
LCGWLAQNAFVFRFCGLRVTRGVEVSAEWASVVCWCAGVACVCDRVCAVNVYFVFRVVSM